MEEAALTLCKKKKKIFAIFASTNNSPLFLFVRLYSGGWTEYISLFGLQLCHRRWDQEQKVYNNWPTCTNWYIDD